LLQNVANWLKQIEKYCNCLKLFETVCTEMSATLDPVKMNDDHPLYVTDAVNAANEIHLVAMLDDAPPPAPNKWGSKGKPDKKTGGKGKGKMAKRATIRMLDVR
jgi:hypothetical protein